MAPMITKLTRIGVDENMNLLGKSQRPHASMLNTPTRQQRITCGPVAEPIRFPNTPCAKATAVKITPFITTLLCPDIYSVKSAKRMLIAAQVNTAINGSALTDVSPIAQKHSAKAARKTASASPTNARRKVARKSVPAR